MAQYRCLMSWEISTALSAEDAVVNTFYLDTDALPGADDPQSLIADATALWRTYRPMPGPWDRVRGRIYNMSDPEPRQPKGETLLTTAPSGVGGPREVALCLSYYADNNLPRRRGRMYIGPWFKTDLDERPDAAQFASLQALAEGISGLGGVNVQWVQYSPTTKEFHNVTNWWVDDEWDTMRSRGLKGTTRQQGTVNG